MRTSLLLITIIRAGLITESNGKALTSGVMLYINPAEHGDAKLTSAISVATPTEFLRKEMKLYKDEIEEDGYVYWKDNLPISPNHAIVIAVMLCLRQIVP
jgi:hypothetical protein